MTVQEAANRHGNDKVADVVVRSSRDDDVDAMVAIYLHHILVGVDASGSYGFDGAATHGPQAAAQEHA
jgi:hypothetical protein